MFASCHGLTTTSKELDALLQRKLRDTHNDFQPAAKYIEKWHYVTDANGTVRYAQ